MTGKFQSFKKDITDISQNIFGKKYMGMNKKNTIIYVIRHGEFDNPRRVFYERVLNFHLNERGKKHVRELGGRLSRAGEIPDFIYSSPLYRACETAGILSRVFGGVQIKKDRRLLERDSRGIATRPQALERRWKDTYKNLRKDYWVESPFHQAERIHKVIQDVLRRHGGKIVYLVSHGDPLAFTVYHVLHPKNFLPSIHSLHKHFYPKKSQAFRIEFDREGRVLNRKVFSK